MQDSGLHHGHLMSEICKKRDIHVIMINISKFGGGCYLSSSIHTLDNLDTLYVDDEGLFNNDDEDYKGAFYFGEYQQPLFGHGLIIGSDIEGESKDVLSTIKSIEKAVKFINENTGRYLLERMQNNGFTFIPL